MIDAAALTPPACAAPAPAQPPRTVYLWYADGEAQPPGGFYPCAGKTPPPYRCSFAPTVTECKRQIQRVLDRWYAPFNVVFTLEKPAGGIYTTVAISGSNQWCGQEKRI